MRQASCRESPYGVFQSLSVNWQAPKQNLSSGTTTSLIFQMPLFNSRTPLDSWTLCPLLAVAISSMYTGTGQGPTFPPSARLGQLHD